MPAPGPAGSPVRGRHDTVLAVGDCEGTQDFEVDVRFTVVAGAMAV